MRNKIVLTAIITGIFSATAAMAATPLQTTKAADTAPASTPAEATSATPDAEKIKSDNLKILPSDYVMGNKGAKITIFEYASLSCPHCAEFHANTLPRIKSAYLDKGKVNLVFRDFPLDEPALRASMLTHCVGKAKGADTFYKYMRALFASQETWAFDPVNFKGTLANIARIGGTDKATFDACMANADIEKEVLGNRKTGSDMGINSTPTFFINGKMLQGGKPFEEFKAEIDPLLKAK